MYISVYYQEKRDMGTITNIDGEYLNGFNYLKFS